MSPTTSIYLDGLADAQRAFVVHANEQFRRHSSGPDTDLYWNYVGEDVDQYIDETIKRWLGGERIKLGRNGSPRELEPRDVLLAHLSNPDDGSCEEQNFFLALVLPGMIERLLAPGEDGETITVTIDTFFNCRENGLVYTVDEPGGSTRSFSVYEHRNSDSIIINGCSDWDGESQPCSADSKNAFFAEIPCGNYAQAADSLTFFIIEAARGELGADIELVNGCEHLDWAASIAKSIPEFGAWLKDKGVEPMNRMRELE